MDDIHYWYKLKFGVILCNKINHSAHWLLGQKCPIFNRKKLHWMVKKNTRWRRTIKILNCSALLIFHACTLLNSLEMCNTIFNKLKFHLNGMKFFLFWHSCGVHLKYIVSKLHISNIKWCIDIIYNWAATFQMFRWSPSAVGLNQPVLTSS